MLSILVGMMLEAFGPAALLAAYNSAGALLASLVPAVAELVSTPGKASAPETMHLLARAFWAAALFLLELVLWALKGRSLHA